MNRNDLVRTLEAAGCTLVRRGGTHDWYRNPETGMSQPVPRSGEIKAHLVRHLLRMLESPADETEAGDEGA